MLKYVNVNFWIYIPVNPAKKRFLQRMKYGTGKVLFQKAYGVYPEKRYAWKKKSP
jgi:hypothetical protein